MTKTSGVNRREFVSVAAATVAATQFGIMGTAIADAPASDNSAVRPFKVQFIDEQLADMRRRIRATRWPDRETVPDSSQGVQLTTIRHLAQYWAGGYNWRKCEAKLNAHPQFLTQIDGLDIHFIHARSKHKDALPLIVTHGWPGSIIEQLKIIEPLVNPTAHGGTAADAFHVVVPSVPGYGFSGKPSATGWGPNRTAAAWITLMKRLGYRQFVAQGGDIGAIISTAMAVQAPPELLGIHTNFPAAVPQEVSMALASGAPPPVGFTSDEKAAYEQLADLRAKHFAYAVEMSTRPQTLYALSDSPVALAAWLFDHGDAWGQPAATISSAIAGRTINGHSAGDVTRDDVLDNFTLYWLTNTGVSAARFYWENKGMSAIGAVDVSIPAAITVFPGEIYEAPRTWVEQSYHKLIHYNRVAKGGHFAAWEQPQLFTEELRASFKSLHQVAAQSVK